jgi:hypothetical protein
MVLIVALFFSQMCFAAEEMFSCLSPPSAFKPPCTIVYEKGVPVVDVGNSRMDLLEKSPGVFLFYLVAAALSEGLSAEQAKELIEVTIAQRAGGEDALASFDWRALSKDEDGFHLPCPNDGKKFVFYFGREPDPEQHAMKIEYEKGQFITVDFLHDGGPLASMEPPRFDEEDVMYFITDPEDLPDGMSMSDLNPSELHLLLRSPYDHVCEAALAQLAETGDERSLGPIEDHIRSLSARIENNEKERNAFMETMRVDKETDLGSLMGSLADKCKGFRSYGGELREKRARFNAAADRIRKRAGIRTPARPSTPNDRRWAPILNEYAGDILPYRDETFKWEDFQQVETYYAEKDGRIDLGYGWEDVVYIRRHKILVHKKTGRKYFTSKFPPNHAFAMAAGSMFFELLGLPVRQTRVVVDDEGQSILIRERIEEGCSFNQYSQKYGKSLDFNERWMRILRSSLLLDQIIGYTDRDDTNLFAAIDADGELVPLFVDMKFSFGNPKMFSPTEEGAETELTYDFSKYVASFEKGRLPEGFAHNIYQASATREDMEWMARYVMRVRPEQIDAIVDLVDSCVEGHTYDIDRLKAEWKNSLARMKEIYESAAEVPAQRAMIFGQALSAWDRGLDSSLWGTMAVFRKRFVDPLYRKLAGLGVECEEFKRVKPQALVLYADDILNDVVMFDLEESLKGLVKGRNVLAGGKIVLYTRDMTLADEVEKLRFFIERTIPETKVVVIRQSDHGQLAVRSQDSVKEVEELIELLPAKGVDANNVLAIVKGHKGRCVDQFKKYDLAIPLIMLNLNGVGSGEKGVFSLSGILEEAIRCVNNADIQGSSGWISILDPMDKITAKMYEQYLIYRNEVLVKA